jgi:hypothetical protein
MALLYDLQMHSWLKMILSRGSVELKNNHGFVVYAGKSHEEKELGLKITKALRTFFDLDPLMTTETKVI